MTALFQLILIFIGFIISLVALNIIVELLNEFIFKPMDAVIETVEHGLDKHKSFIDRVTKVLRSIGSKIFSAYKILMGFTLSCALIGLIFNVGKALIS